MPIEIIEAGWSAPRQVRALCTTRQGGASSKPYDSLNLAPHVGDDAGNLARNRELIRQSLNLPGEPCWLKQTHSTDVVQLDCDNNRTADAAISGRPDTIAVVMVADCLPILLCNRAGTEVAAVHAGWRGLVDGVVQAAVQQMESTPDELLAWIGPAISQPAFEVGEEVRNQFLARYNRADERFV
ncbi:MAG: peptidoglycan editing factor PgeF, partial [Gammaproteobacteria bacterium]